MRISKLVTVIDKGEEVEFRRTDGEKMYHICAYWDKSCSSWFQGGAPIEILKENTTEVERYFYNKFSFHIKDLVR